MNQFETQCYDNTEFIKILKLKQQKSRKKEKKIFPILTSCFFSLSRVVNRNNPPVDMNIVMSSTSTTTNSFQKNDNPVGNEDDETTSIQLTTTTDSITKNKNDTSCSVVPQQQTGIAGRTNYAQWDKITTNLVKEVEHEDEKEIAIEKSKLGLDGKYANSQAEADERSKLKQAQETKKKLKHFESRQIEVMQEFKKLLGPVRITDTTDGGDNDGNTLSANISEIHEGKIVRITRDIVDAFKRVVSIQDTSGSSMDLDKIIITQDLSHLESKVPTNSALKVKQFPDDAENDVVETEKTPSDNEKYRNIGGLIKLFISNVHNCTVSIKCKIITGTVEVHNCSNVKICVESTATVATIQADLSNNIIIEYHDAPSGQHVPGQHPMLYWGDDKNDRIYHAGITNMIIRRYRDSYMEDEIKCDYVKDGAEAIGNASAKECQFITSCIDGKLQTEKVVRTAGTSTGKNAKAMTERELKAEKENREKAAKYALKMAEDMIQIKDKDGNILVSKKNPTSDESDNKNNDDDVVEELFTSMSNDEIKMTVGECDELKIRGNEAFAAGEYAQAILQYTLAMDKADELPDRDTVQNASSSTVLQLYPRDIVLSNRAACFLKLGHHEKAQVDAMKALEYNPENIKANFRLGLSLHAQNKYMEAIPILAKSYKMEPHNKQIKQALQFCEINLEKERRKQL